MVIMQATRISKGEPYPRSASSNNTALGWSATALRTRFITPSISKGRFRPRSAGSRGAAGSRAGRSEIDLPGWVLPCLDSVRRVCILATSLTVTGGGDGGYVEFGQLVAVSRPGRNRWGSGDLTRPQGRRAGGGRLVRTVGIGSRSARAAQPPAAP